MLLIDSSIVCVTEVRTNCAMRLGVFRCMSLTRSYPATLLNSFTILSVLLLILAKKYLMFRDFISSRRFSTLSPRGSSWKKLSAVAPKSWKRGPCCGASPICIKTLFLDDHFKLIAASIPPSTSSGPSSPPVASMLPTNSLNILISSLKFTFWILSDPSWWSR